MQLPTQLLVADAAKADDLPAVRKLIKEHADVNTPANDGSTALLWAAYHSDVEMTKALLAAGAAVDAANHYGVTPLLQASRNGDVEVMRALLDAGADPTRWHPEGETPLMAASRTGHVDAVKLLLSQGLVRQRRGSVSGRDRAHVGVRRRSRGGGEGAAGRRRGSEPQGARLHDHDAQGRGPSFRRLYGADVRRS